MILTLSNAAAGITLAPLQLEHAERLLALRLNNRTAHERYEPRREEDFFTLEGQRQLIAQRLEEARQDRAYLFGIFLLDGTLIGQITLSNMVRGVGQFADIGYSIDQRMQSKGYMSAAVALVAEFAFRALGLHRIQAAILPDNDASRRVLEKNGFQAEGIARKLVKINGEWQDHRMYALLADDLL